MLCCSNSWHGFKILRNFPMFTLSFLQEINHHFNNIMTDIIALSDYLYIIRFNFLSFYSKNCDFYNVS